ncbi:hypothetical protein Sjap_017045 [Stephania japonica]|uniref:Uncharacterized protein n=1 Tax=Stephania japonica TaxID=461633 RepID=A0AAP0NJW6_9MAGN
MLREQLRIHILLLQQMQMQMMQQQQQQPRLPSSVFFPKHPSHQPKPFSESNGHLQTGSMSTSNDSIDRLAFKPAHKLLHTNLQMPPHPTLQGGISAAACETMPSQVFNDMELHMRYKDPLLHLPRQIFENSSCHKVADVTMTEQTNEDQQNDSLMEQSKSGHALSSASMGSSLDSDCLPNLESSSMELTTTSETTDSSKVSVSSGLDEMAIQQDWVLV